MTDPAHTDRTLQTARTLAGTAAAIYAAFADPARLAQWWGPQGFTNRFETFEFKTGGRWRFVMHGPDGHDYRNECIFAELAADRRIVIQHVPPPRFTLTVSLLPTADGTQVRWVQVFEDPAVAAAVRHVAEPGNEQNLDRLSLHLGAGS